MHFKGPHGSSLPVSWEKRVPLNDLTDQLSSDQIIQSINILFLAEKRGSFLKRKSGQVATTKLGPGLHSEWFGGLIGTSRRISFIFRHPDNGHIVEWFNHEAGLAFKLSVWIVSFLY